MKIYRTALKIQGAVLENGNPLPRFRDREQNKTLIDAGLLENEREGFGYQTGFRELPYLVQESYHRDLQERELAAIVMENDFLRAEFLADYGGRLWSLFDKKAGRELLFTNPVLRIANLAIRNAWFSGGIEWNLGQFGHTCLTCEPMFFARCTDSDGTPFLRMYEYERQKCFFLQVDFHLPEDSACLFAHVKIVNTKPESVPLYWWTNIAVREEHNVRVFSGSDGVICIQPETMTSQSVRGFAHDTMPFLKTLNGKDGSYPRNLPYSNEYFFQNRPLFSDAWEVAAYNDGTAFWERSTPTLRYRKMFCWGVQRGGRHWKDFLSLDGQGDYFEIQAGLSPTQVHGRDIAPNGCVRFTQAFGGMNVDTSRAFASWEKSKAYVYDLVEGRLGAEELKRADRRFESLEDAAPDEILHFGSGWGALEAERDPEIVPKGLVFPRETMGTQQAPWLALLRTGKLPDLEPGTLPVSWMTDSRWAALLARSLEKEENRNAAVLLHLGLMLYEEGKWQEGVAAMEQSLKLRPTAICCRNLASAAAQEEDWETACEYMEQALSLGGAEQSAVFAQDAIDIFTRAGRFERAWNCYRDLPQALKNVERVRLNTVQAAFELQKWDFLEEQFASDFAVMREGETMLLDTWFNVQAVRLAQERGVPDWHVLLDEVRANCHPPYNLDFRMTISS
ncbi:MAG: DUF5107 domain-containing protein [Clostridiales bacterium]|nr:DUF5107 domain-containing protein [Clostridiales bacterium]